MTTASPAEPGDGAATAHAADAPAAAAAPPPAAPPTQPAEPDAGPITTVGGGEAQAASPADGQAGEAVDGDERGEGAPPPPPPPPPADGPDAPRPAPPPLVKKRKVALFVAYVGAGYYGMQFNKDLPTIERALRDAIAAAGGIAAANVGDDFSKIGWSRAARTDRGVSALGQVVSLRLLTPAGAGGDDDDSYDPAPAINAALPPAIRILGVARVTSSFDARKACDRRRYEYVLPAWAFDPRAGVARTDAKASQKAAADGGGAPPPVTQEAPADDDDKPFVFDDAARDRVTAILKAYEGTHNFHNFTVRMDGADPTANRYILSFTCEGTVEIGGQPWVRLVVLGQSFILHQIRKMVGTALAVARGAAPPGSIEAAMRPGADVTTPLAPDTGLFLDESIFHTYNRRWGDARGEGHRLDLGRFAAAAAAFKAEHVYPHIAAREAADGTMAEFLRGLNDRNFRFSGWATAGRRVPAAERKRGLSGRGGGGGGAPTAPAPAAKKAAMPVAPAAAGAAPAPAVTVPAVPAVPAYAASLYEAAEWSD